MAFHSFANADPSFKILLLGNSGVGKTSLARCFEGMTRVQFFFFSSTHFLHDYASHDYDASCSLDSSSFSDSVSHTIGVDFIEKSVSVRGGGERVTLQLWDTAGQERYVNFIWYSYVVQCYSGITPQQYNRLAKRNHPDHSFIQPVQICSPLKIPLSHPAVLPRSDGSRPGV